MNWILIVAVFVVQFCTIETCDAKVLDIGKTKSEIKFSFAGSPFQSLTVCLPIPGHPGLAQAGLDPRSDYNCYDHDGRAYVGDIPHPSNCNQYLSCTLTFN